MRPKPIPLLAGVLAVFAVNATALHASSSITPEEAKAEVQRAYAKLTFAIDVGTVHSSVIPGTGVQTAALSRALDARELQIELCDFQIIALRDAAGVRFRDILTQPDGTEVLQIAPRVFSRVVEPTATTPRIEVADNSAAAQWAPGETVSANWDVPVEEAAPSFEHPNWWKTIVSYSVTVRFQGKTRDYRAFFLFGADEQGNQQILPVDTVLQGGALYHFLTASIYPATLLRTEYRAEPAVMNWLRSNQRFDLDCPTGEACCDLTALKCGLLSADLDQELGTAPVVKPKPGIHPENLCGDDCGGGFYCSDYSGDTQPGGPYINGDNTEHTSLSHTLIDQPAGSCTYWQSGGRLPNGQYPCVSTANASFSSTIHYEQGTLLHPNYCHVPSFSGTTQGASGQHPTAYAESAMAIQACYVFCVCSPVSITYRGIQAQFNPSNPLWKWNHQYANTCPYLTSPYPSPIVISLSGESGLVDGFTSMVNGVRFDFYGTGTPIQISWTAANSNIGFLVLDRNGDGKIDSAKEMFGNITAQPPSDDPNGYLALAVFDLPANGGNGNGIIDPNDDVWSKLRVWVDTSHTADSRLGKLYTLDELGIRSIGLKYVEERVVDQFGNTLRYKGTIDRDPAFGNILFTHDVFFDQPLPSSYPAREPVDKQKVN